MFKVVHLFTAEVSVDDQPADVGIHSVQSVVVAVQTTILSCLCSVISAAGRDRLGSQASIEMGYEI